MLSLAKEAINTGDYDQAIALLRRTEKYPDNMGEGKLFGTQENDIHYWFGCAHQGLGEEDKAIYYWKKASKGLAVQSAAIFYNDQQPDKVFYQGLALLKLGKQTEAHNRFNGLKSYGLAHLSDKVKIDYFAVSLPDLLIWEDDLNKRNRIHCKYMMGLGYLGLRDERNANLEFEKVLKEDVNHLGASIHKKMNY